MARIIEFEGRRIQVPDDASQEEIQQILSAQPAAAAAPAAPAAEPSMVDQIMSGADYAASTGASFLSGARRGATGLLGLPVDAINGLFGLAGVPVSSNPVGGSQWIDDLVTAPRDAVAEAVGATPGDSQPRDALQEGFMRVGQEIGATMVPVGGALRIADVLGTQGVRQLPDLARMFLEPAAVNPSRFIANELGMAAGAGTGAAIANQFVDPSTTAGQWADVGGALLGGGVTALGGGIAKSVGEVGSALFSRDSYVDEVVRDTVTDEIAAASGAANRPGQAIDTEELANTIMNGPRVSDTIPGFVESTADRAQSPNLAALEYGRQSGPNSGLFAQRRTENTAAIDESLSSIQPNATPGQFSGALDAERTQWLASARESLTAANSEFDMALRRLETTYPNETARGTDIRSSLEDAEAAARQVEDNAWANAVDTSASIDATPLAEEFAAVDSALTATEAQQYRPALADIPGRLAAAPDGVEGLPPGPVSLREVTSLRSGLTSEIRKATSGVEPDDYRARVLGQYVDALDRFIDRLGYGEAFQEARNVSRSVNDRFNRAQTAISQTLARNGGVPQMDPSAVPRRFVQPDNGRITDYQALMREAGTDTRARGAVEDQIIADARAAGVADDPARLEQYLAERRIMFADFPELRSRFEQVGRTRTNLDAATESESYLRDTLTQQGRGPVANYLSYGDENASRAMQSVLASRNPAAAIDELLTFVNDEPRAVEGARRVFWDVMEGNSRSRGNTTMTMGGAQPWLPVSLRNFIENPVNSAVMERLYRGNPEHLEKLREIVGAIQGVDLRNRAKAPNSSGTAQGVNPLLTPETLQSRLYAYQSGKISGSFLATSIAAVSGRRAVRNARAAAIQRLLDEALLNPDVAATLLRENNPANRAAMRRKAKLWLGNEASTIVNSFLGEEEEDDEIVSTVMQ